MSVLYTPREAAPVLRALRAARKLLNDRDRWCKGTLACDALGNSVEVLDPSACRWCAVGAIQKVSPSWSVEQDARHALERVAGAMGWGRSAEDVNDRHNHFTVISMYAVAIDAIAHQKAATP